MFLDPAFSLDITPTEISSWKIQYALFVLGRRVDGVLEGGWNRCTSQTVCSERSHIMKVAQGGEAY